MSQAKRSVAVVGANGFLGGALTRHLQERQIPVSRFTRSHSCVDEFGKADPDLLAAGTVFWLAGSIRPAMEVSPTASGAADADYRALVTMLDSLDVPVSGIRQRIIVVSSGGTVYDSRVPGPHREDSRLSPANRYGEAMLAVERVIGERAADCVVLRVANAYGPGQRARQGQGVIAYWLNAISSGEAVTVLGRDDVARDYVFVDDVATALIMTHELPAVPTTINIGSGNPTSLRELLELVRETVAPHPVEVRHSPSRSFDAPSTWLDISLAKRALGWRPMYDLSTGLQQTWKHVRVGRNC